MVGYPSSSLEAFWNARPADAVSQPWPGLTRDLSGIVETAVKVMARICMTGVSSLPRGEGHSAPIASIENKSL